jgi:hypothetical protein
MGATMRGATLAAVMMLTAAGCGGSSKTYSPMATADCLRANGMTVVRLGRIDFIARQAKDGYYVTLQNGHALNLSFGDASAIKRAYSSVSVAKLESRGNAVLAWDDYSPADGQQVQDCLR